MFETEVEFTLPLGYLDSEGTLHREGVMRLATAADEILPLKDPRVQQNPAYLIVILLSRVVTRLGAVGQVTPKLIESLYASDLAHLQALYNRLNQVEASPSPVTCPQCAHAFQYEVAPPGG
jgi:phage FluMu protein gp41